MGAPERADAWERAMARRRLRQRGGRVGVAERMGVVARRTPPAQAA